MGRKIIYYLILKFCNNNIKILNNLQRKYADTICKNGGDIHYGSTMPERNLMKSPIYTNSLGEIENAVLNAPDKETLHKRLLIDPNLELENTDHSKAVPVA